MKNLKLSNNEMKKILGGKGGDPRPPLSICKTQCYDSEGTLVGSIEVTCKGSCYSKPNAVGCDEKGPIEWFICATA
ncbi:MAG: hypothetical protein FWC10_07540 [Lentimicrobiaceae bacterium]|nr:hypothetical protein [Lentimicrobiaceae bacterium]